MPTKKISDLPQSQCNHPEHNPPMHQVFENGIYEHECPACGKKKTFTVNNPTFTEKLEDFKFDDESPNYIRSSQEEI